MLYFIRLLHTNEMGSDHNEKDTVLHRFMGR